MNRVLSLSDPPSHKEGVCSNTVTSAGWVYTWSCLSRPHRHNEVTGRSGPDVHGPLSALLPSPPPTLHPRPRGEFLPISQQRTQDWAWGLDGSTRCADTAPKWTAKPHSLSLGHFPGTAVEQNPLSGQDLGTAPGCSLHLE